MENSSGTLQRDEQSGMEKKSFNIIPTTEISQRMFFPDNGSFNYDDKEMDEHLNLESLPVHEQEEYDGIVDSSVVETSSNHYSKLKCINAISEEMTRDDVETSEEDAENEVCVDDVCEEDPPPQIIIVSSSDEEDVESDDGKSIGRESSSIPVFEEYCSILNSREVKVTKGDEGKEVEIDSKNSSLELSASPISAEVQPTESNTELELENYECIENEVVDEASIDVDPLLDGIVHEKIMNEDHLEDNPLNKNPLEEHNFNDEPLSDGYSENYKKPETLDYKSTDHHEKRTEDECQLVDTDDQLNGCEVQCTVNNDRYDEDNLLGYSKGLKKTFGKKSTSKTLSIRARRPRKAKEGLTYVENLLIATVRNRPVGSERQLGKKAQFNGNPSNIPAKRSRTLDVSTDADAKKIQSADTVEICIASPDDLSKAILPEFKTETDENKIREEKPMNGSSTSTTKPLRRSLWNLTQKFKRKPKFEMHRSKQAYRSVVAKKEHTLAKSRNGEQERDVEVLPSISAPKKNVKLYHSPRVMSSPRKATPKKPSLPINFSNPYAKKWTYTPEHIQDLFADGKFVIHREDLGTSSKFDRLEIWRIIKDARVLRKFVPFRIDGRMCHVATDTFKAIPSDEDKFVYDYQPVLFDLIIDTPEYALGMYHHLTSSFPFLGGFKHTSNLFQPYQMFLKQLIIQAMSDNAPVESSQSTTGFETIEKKIHEIVEASMKYKHWPEDTKRCVYYHPTMIFSKSAIDKQKNCVSCTILRKKGVSSYRIAFNGASYDAHTFIFFNKPDPPQPDHQFCWSCANNLRVLHRLYHYKYWTYIAIRDILGRLYRTLKPEEVYDADCVYQFLVADFKWIRQMFYELQTLLADGLKLQNKLEKQIPNVTLGTRKGSVVTETNSKSKKSMWMQGRKKGVWLNKARNGMNGATEKKAKPAIKLKKEKESQKSRLDPQKLERPPKRKYVRKKLPDTQTSSKGGRKIQNSTKSSTNQRQKTASRKNSEDAEEMIARSLDVVSAVEICDSFATEPLEKQTDEKQQGKTTRNSIPNCQAVNSAFNGAAAPSFYKNPQCSAIAIS